MVRRIAIATLAVVTLTGRADDCNSNTIDDSLELIQGTKVTYFNPPEVVDPAYTGVDEVIDEDLSISRPPGVNVGGTIVTWTGTLIPPVSGEYMFVFTSSGCKSLTIGSVLFDSQCSLVVEESIGFLTLDAGVPYDFSATCSGGTLATIRLEWILPGSGVRQLIPASVFTRPNDCNENGVLDECEAIDPNYRPVAEEVPAWSDGSDIVIELGATVPTDAPVSTTITRFPSSGFLIRYSEDQSGSLISDLDPMIYDPLNRVIFRPASLGTYDVDFNYLASTCAASADSDSTVTVTVNAEDINNPPSITASPLVEMDAPGPFAITGTSVTDDDAGTSELRITLSVTNGIISLAQTTGLTFQIGDGNTDREITFRGTLVDLNSALASISFVPDSCRKVANIEITANDLGQSGLGGPQQSSATINIDITVPGGIAFNDFSSVPNISILGDATFVDNKLRLTQSTSGQTGAAWACDKLTLNRGFSTSFDYQISNENGPGGDGGEGFAFVIYHKEKSLEDLESDSPDPDPFSLVKPRGVDAPEEEYDDLPGIGIGGSGLGFAGIPKTLAIAFDTHDPQTSGYTRVSIQTRANLANSTDTVFSIATSEPLPALNDGLVHNVAIDYVPGLLSVYVDDLLNPVLTANVELGHIFQRPYVDNTLDDGFAAGFTASTGDASEVHDILSWSLDTMFKDANVAPVATLAGAAYESDMTGGCLAYGTSPHHLFDLGQDMTIEAWVRTDAYSPAATILTKGGSGSGSTPGNNLLNYQLRQVDGGKLAFRFRNAENTQWNEYKTNDQVFKVGTWAHIAVTYTFGDAESLKLYVNGQVVEGSWTDGSGADKPAIFNEEGSISPIPSSDSVPFNLLYSGVKVLGLDDVPSGPGPEDPLGTAFVEEWSGALDELRIWSKTRSQAEIQANMNTRLETPQDCLISNWRYDYFEIFDLDGGCLGMVTPDLANFTTPLNDFASIPSIPGPGGIPIPIGLDAGGGCTHAFNISDNILDWLPTGPSLPSDFTLSDITGGCSTSGAPITEGEFVIPQGEEGVHIALGGYDGDGDSIKAIVKSLPEHGMLNQVMGLILDGGATIDANAVLDPVIVDNPLSDSLKRVYYEPNSSEPIDHFTFAITDGTSESQVTTVTIKNYNFLNDPPVITVPPRLPVPYNGTLKPSDYALDQQTALGVYDVDAGSSEVEVLIVAQHGTLLLESTFGVTFVNGSENGSKVLNFTALTSDFEGFSDMQSALNSLIYTPDPGFIGLDKLMIAAYDGGASGIGDPQSREQCFYIDVVNQPPVAVFAGEAADFPSGTSSAMVQVPNHPSLDFVAGEPISLEAWVTVEGDILPKHTILGKYRWQNGRANYSLYMSTSFPGSYVPAFAYHDSSGTIHEFVMQGITVSQSEPVHVAFTYVLGQQETAQFYLNGQPVAGVWANGSGNVPPDVVDAPLYLAKMDGPDYLEGQLDEVRIWRAIRTPEEIERFYDELLPFGDPRLVAHYSFEDGGTLVAQDSSDFANHGTYLNGAKTAASVAEIYYVSTLAFQDVPVPLSFHDPEGDTSELTATVVTAPLNGQLFESVGGVAGAPITPPYDILPGNVREVVYRPAFAPPGENPVWDAFTYQGADAGGMSNITTASINLVAPQISVEKVEIVNDNDGKLAPSECAGLVITLRNDSIAPISDISGQLVSGAAGIGWNTDSQLYGSMDVQTTSTNAGAFEIWTSPDFDCTVPHYLVLQVSSQYGDVELPVEISPTQQACEAASSCGKPFLQLYGLNLPDFDGSVDPDDCVQLDVDVTNIGDALADSVSATLTANTTDVLSIQQGLSGYGSIGTGDIRRNLSTFRFTTSPDMVCGTTISLTLTLTSANSESFVVPIEVGTGAPNIVTAFTADSTVFIGDGDPTSSTQSLTVDGLLGGTVHSVRVFTHITSALGVTDLILKVQAPNGQVFQLSADGYSNGLMTFGATCPADYDDLVFDDNATTSIADAVDPVTGAYRPRDSFSSLVGQPASDLNGTWTLFAQDTIANSSTSALECWSVEVEERICGTGSGECSPNTSSAPDITITEPGGAIPVVVEVPVSMVYPTGQESTLFYTVEPITASTPADYESSEASVTIAEDTTTAAIHITVHPDFLPEGEEQFRIVFTSATGGVILGDTETIVTIQDSSDVSVTKSVQDDVVSLGQNVTFTIEVQNLGASNSGPIEVVDTLPSGLTFINTTATSGICGQDSGVVTCQLDPMIASGSEVITLQIVAAAAQLGLFENSVTATVLNDTDPDTSNNSASVEVSVINDCNNNEVEDNDEIGNPTYQPTASGANVTTDEDTEILITLLGNDPTSAAPEFVVTSLPGNGRLFQSNGGFRGAEITLAPAVVTDPAHQVYFVPDPEESGSIYASFQFIVDNCVQQSLSATVDINVNAVADAPLLSELVLTSPVNEGSTATLTGTLADGDSGDTFSLEIKWEDFSATETLELAAGTTTFTLTHVYTDDRPEATPSDAHVVSIYVADNTGLASAAELLITVNNVEPGIVNFNATEVISEHGDATVSFTTTDPGADTLTVSIEWGDGTSVTLNGLLPGMPFNYGHSYEDDNPTVTPSDIYTITATVTDDDTGTTSVESLLTVSNVAPELSDLALTQPLNEGGVGNLTGNISDVSSEDTFTLTVNWGDGSALETFEYPAGTTSFDETHTYSHSGNISVEVTLIDDDGGEDSDSLSAVVANVAPTIAQLTINGPIDEGDITPLSFDIIDPDTNDSFIVEVNWGDGTSTETIPVPAGATTFSQLHQYLDDNPSGTPIDTNSVVVIITDSDGGSLSESIDIDVNNVDPNLFNLNIASPVTEGDVVTLVGDIQDPAIAVRTDRRGSVVVSTSLDTFTLEINWGDGVIESLPLAAGSKSFTATHVYEDDNPSVTPSDVYTINVEIADDDGGMDAADIAVTVDNGEITIDSADIVSPVAVSTETTLTATFSDPGTSDTFMIVLDWNDGSLQEVHSLPAGSRSFSVNHIYTDIGSFQPTLTIEDDDFSSDSANLEVVVTSTPPLIVGLTGVSPIQEDGITTLTGEVVDPDLGETFTLLVNWGDGSATEEVEYGVDDTTFSLTHQYLDDSPSGTASDDMGISVVAVDSTGANGSNLTTVTVENIAPTLENLSINASILQNQAATLMADIHDVGTLDTFTLDVDWGDGNSDTYNYAAGVTSFGETHQYTTFGTYTVTALLTDDDGGTALDTVEIEVLNPEPSITGLEVISPISENDVTTLGVTISDIAEGDSHTLQVSWGDGSVDSIVVSPGEVEIAHQYLDDNPSVTAADVYSITATVTDSSNGSDTESVDVTVNNVAPILEDVQVSSSSIAENGTVGLTANIVDPGTQDTFIATITWGDGSSPEVISLPAGTTTLNASHQYLDDDPTATSSDNYDITIVVADDDSGEMTGGAAVTVNNTAPILSGVGVSAVPSGEAILTGNITDPGTLDTFAMTVDWGDGNVEAFNLVAGATSFSFQHTYAASGQYPVGLSMVDDDLGSASASTTAIVPSQVAVDLDIQKTSGAAIESCNVTYTITVTNLGAETATGVTVVDTMPTNVTVQSTDPSCDSSGGSLVCNLGSLASGTSTTLTVVGVPTGVGQITNVATVTSNEVDADELNNTASHTTTITQRASGPDLTGSFGNVIVRCRESRRGIRCSIQARAFAVNSGDTKAGRAIGRMYLSDDATLSSDDWVLTRRTDRLRAGQTKKITLRATPPPAIDLNGKYLIFVVDDDEQVAESCEQNNVIIYGPMP